MVSGRTTSFPSDGRGPCVRFEGINLELSSFSGCGFDFAKDGNLVLTFDNFSGTVTLRGVDSRGAAVGDSSSSHQQPLCSTGSDAGSLGLLDPDAAMDIDMALSQLEQESPRSRMGMVYSPSVLRQTCEGGEQNQQQKQQQRHPESASKCQQRRPPNSSSSTSPDKPKKATENDENSGGFSTSVSPPSDDTARMSPVAGAPNKRSAAAAAITVGEEGGSPAAERRASRRAVSPETPSPSSSSRGSSKRKAKRARRSPRSGVSNAGKDLLTAAEAGGNGGGGSSANGRKKRAHQLKSARQAAEGAATGKETKRGSEIKGTTTTELTASQPVTGDKDGVVQVVTADENVIPMVAADSNDNGIDEQEKGEQKPEEVSQPAASSAAAAWLASGAATSAPPPAPLSRSAKATTVDTLRQLMRGEAGPMGRWGHSATMITESMMLVLGGQADDEAHQATLGDMYKFDFETETWSRPMNCDSIPRAWHTASFIPDKNLLVIFGGERTVDGCPECLDDIMVLDTDIDLIYPPAISGKSPSSRSGHSAAMIGTDLVVFGGVRGRKWQNNVAVLDTERWHWRHPTIDGSNPAPRSYHSATVVGNLMVVFGGNNQHESFDRVYVLDTSKPRWVWSCPEVVGAAPAARTGHSALLLPDGHTILIHGGWDPEDEGGVKNFGDAYLLDTSLWEWSRGPESLLSGAGGASAGAGGDLEKNEVSLRVGHTGLLARSGGGGGVGVGGWKASFFGGQDGGGVRRSDLALLSL